MILIALFVLGMAVGASAASIYFRKELDLDQKLLQQATEALSWSNQTLKQYADAEQTLRDVVRSAPPASSSSGWLN